eukprot:9483307-Pyramimonas_sp.AAC.2
MSRRTKSLPCWTRRPVSRPLTVCRPRHGHMASVKNWRAGELNFPVMRWLIKKVLVVNSTVTMSRPDGVWRGLLTAAAAGTASLPCWRCATRCRSTASPPGRCPHAAGTSTRATRPRWAAAGHGTTGQVRKQ